MLSELFGALSTKVAAAAVAGLATAGTSVAAATGNLPGDLQDQAAAVAENFGVDLPDSGEVQNAERQDEGNRQDDGNGQDDVTTQDGEGTDTDDAVLEILGDGASPGDEDFGTNVSDNAQDGDLGDAVSGTASDGASDRGTTSTTGDDASASESEVSDDYRPDDPPSDAPSDSGDTYSDDASESDADSNPGDEHRPE